MARDFWRSAGMHLLRSDGRGWLEVTEDYLRAYLTRPEVHPVEESCDEEIRLHEDLMADPFREVAPDRLSRLADSDAADNYRALLAFRSLLQRSGTIEDAYLAQVRDPNPHVPPLFMDQMVHLIVRNILRDTSDPMWLRSGEIFFREQSASTDNGHVMLADEEIVEMHARSNRESGIGQLLAATGTPAKTVDLDVLREDNKHIYWERSDKFDTVVDFRVGQPAVDAFARVIERWLMHFLQIEVRVEPRERIDDQDWRWHIGLDRQATAVLNALYNGDNIDLEDSASIIALFRMRIMDQRRLIERVRGKPIYLGLGITPAKRLKMKPQNLLANLPLRATS